MAENTTFGNNSSPLVIALYSPPSLQEIIPILIVLSTAIFFALGGNGFTIYAYVRFQELRTPFNTLILNLALADFIVGLIVMPCFAIYNYHGYWPFGEPLCSIWVFADWFVTFELWCVRWPISYKNHSQLKTVTWTILVSWLFTAVIWMPGYFYDRLNHNNTVELCAWDPAQNYAAGIVIGFLGYLIPYVTMVVAYCYVGWKMRRRLRNVLPKVFGGKETITFADTKNDNISKPPIESTTVNGRPSRNQSTEGGEKAGSTMSSRDAALGNVSRRQVMIKRDNSALLALGAVVIAFSLCWIPFYIFFFVTLFQGAELPGWFLTLAYWTAYLNSAVNPVCYTALHRDYRQTFLRTFRFCKPRLKTQPS
ncbi:hypothetical protein RvY_03006 [Ramazzottius varieornatus]|uniref:G-protein coupled receptors family 1 profile domain-containing protein n=1 Tax=Ramazzottius varieornatus TaxID=947166 RepID=A0A1D1UW52_RAMVA|nr:hypothetical protein RvY_03006 [Ramazzottius varieornatus]